MQVLVFCQEDVRNPHTSTVLDVRAVTIVSEWLRGTTVGAMD